MSRPVHNVATERDKGLPWAGYTRSECDTLSFAR